MFPGFGTRQQHNQVFVAVVLWPYTNLTKTIYLESQCLLTVRLWVFGMDPQPPRFTAGMTILFFLALRAASYELLFSPLQHSLSPLCCWLAQ